MNKEDKRAIERANAESFMNFLMYGFCIQKVDVNKGEVIDVTEELLKGNEER